MIQGIDLTNVDSRRAFPMDSRATWVESVHSGNDHHVVAKDNRVLGPGEYTPGLQAAYTKHVPGPALGGSRGMVDHFHPFRSLLSMPTPQDKGSKSRGNGKSKGNNRGYGMGSVDGGESFVTFEDSGYNHNGDSYGQEQGQRQLQPYYSIANDITRDTYKKEGATIFHEHDRRMGIDPYQRRFPTPGCYLEQESLLKSTSSMGGVQYMTKTVHMGPDDIPYGERMEVRAAAPGDYRPDKSFDSKFLRKTPLQTKISGAERRTYFDIQARAIEVQSGVVNIVQEHKETRTANIPTVHSDIAVVARAEQAERQERIKKIRMPILRTRIPPKLYFDASCYTNAKKEASELALHPASLKKEAKIDKFHEYLTLPRKHHSHRLPSRLSDKVKRSVF